jgi:hypothetical protein
MYTLHTHKTQKTAEEVKQTEQKRDDEVSGCNRTFNDFAFSSFPSARKKEKIKVVLSYFVSRLT